MSKDILPSEETERPETVLCENPDPFDLPDLRAPTQEMVDGYGLVMDQGLQTLSRVHTASGAPITPAIMPLLDPAYAARPPAQQADALLIY